MIEIPNNIKNEINLYCKSNNIEDINAFIVKLIVRGFTIEKYGERPIIVADEPKQKKSDNKEDTIIQQPIVNNKIEGIEDNSNKSTDIYDED